MTEIFRKSGEINVAQNYLGQVCTTNVFLIKLLSPQGVNDLGVIGKV